VRQAVAAHIKAVHDCDASALVDGYSANAKVFFPDGAVVKGRKELQGVYDKLRQAA
jgi:ketosteroid isomerase-like protein